MKMKTRRKWHEDEDKGEDGDGDELEDDEEDENEEEEIEEEEEDGYEDVDGGEGRRGRCRRVDGSLQSSKRQNRTFSLDRLATAVSSSE
jgi:hypothetical protein